MIKKIKAKFKARKIRKARVREFIRNIPSSFDHKVISWRAPEYLKFQKGLTWKIVEVLCLLTAIIWGVLFNSWTFSLAILAFAVAYFVVHLEAPKEVEVIISEIGIKVGGRKYPYSQIRAFWIIYHPPFIQTLHIRVRNDMARDIEIQLEGQNPAEVREILISKIPELEGGHVPLGRAITRLFKL